MKDCTYESIVKLTHVFAAYAMAGMSVWVPYECGGAWKLFAWLFAVCWAMAFFLPTLAAMVNTDCVTAFVGESGTCTGADKVVGVIAELHNKAKDTDDKKCCAWRNTKYQSSSADGIPTATAIDNISTDKMA